MKNVYKIRVTPRSEKPAIYTIVAETFFMACDKLRANLKDIYPGQQLDFDLLETKQQSL